MEAPDFLFDGPKDAPLTVVLAHGAGAPMDTPFMNFFAERIAASGLRAARFEFPYMAARRHGGAKRPPDRQPVLERTWRMAIEAFDPGRCVIGGKSMGGRMASLVADEAGVAGLICLGYPFHPPGRPDQLRTEHLERLRTPTLIVQGTRDPLGTEEEAAGYRFSPAIRFHWAEDGDHHLVPRKMSGRSAERNWAEAAAAVVSFAEELERRIA